jgi:hypothetical protein
MSGHRLRVLDVDLGGRRCIRVSSYALQVRGCEPERRVMLAVAWQDDPVLPVSDRCITLPAAAVPGLIEALGAAVSGDVRETTTREEP